MQLTSCKKDNVVQQMPIIGSSKEVEVARISFLGNETIGKIYSFEVAATVNDTILVPSVTSLALIDSTSVGCGYSLSAIIGKRYVFGYKENAGMFVYFWSKTSFIFNSQNDGSPVLTPMNHFQQIGQMNTVIALDYDVSTGIFTPGDGIYTPCPLSDFTLRTGI